MDLLRTQISHVEMLLATSPTPSAGDKGSGTGQGQAQAQLEEGALLAALDALQVCMGT